MADKNKFDEKPNLKAHEPARPASYFSLAKHKPANISELSLKKQLLARVSFHLENAMALFHSAISREFETGLSFHFTPVFMGIGILIYYAVPAEPLLLALALTPICLFALLQMLKFHGSFYYALAACFCLSLGMLAAKLETGRNAAPIIERQVTPHIQGVVLNVDANRRGSPRYLIQPIAMEGLVGSQLPENIRASAVAKHELISPGDIISGRVRLQPVTGPVYPGGYDFSFFAWQNGLGGSGFFIGKPKKLDAGSVEVNWQTRAQIKIN